MTTPDLYIIASKTSAEKSTQLFSVTGEVAEDEVLCFREVLSLLFPVARWNGLEPSRRRMVNIRSLDGPNPATGSVEYPK